jgi:hypothetical protein
MEEEIEVEQIEVDINKEEIDEFIEKLNELKESQGSIEHELADDFELVLNYSEGKA